MDPEARRHMWNVIQQVSSNRTVILVSHLMEEIEALCTRVGVMVSGRLQCLGSVQHLKGKFGGGYEVEVRCHISKAEECLTLCKSSFRCNVTVLECHGGYYRFRLPDSVDIALLFAFFEDHREHLKIVDYSISECTLEQVFLTAVCNSLDAEVNNSSASENNSGRKGSEQKHDRSDSYQSGYHRHVANESSSYLHHQQSPLQQH